MTTDRESSFVFYQSFYDMIECIPDVPTQMLAYKTICDYALRGIAPQTENWVIQMVFCAVKPQIDANSKRRENGKKSGRKAAQPDTAEPQPQYPQAPEVQPIQPEPQPMPPVPPMQPMQSSASVASTPAAQSRPVPAMQPMQSSASAASTLTAQSQPMPPVQPIQARQSSAPVAASTSTAQSQPMQATAPVRSGVFPYGKNEYPVTQAELDKFAAFAKKLFDEYRGGAAPSEADIEKVIELTNVRREIGDAAIAVFDWDKSDLLRYAFEQADAAGKLNWRYIDGMYRRFDQRDIVTGADARQYDFMRHAQAL